MDGLRDAHTQGPSTSQRRAHCQAAGTTRSHFISELSSPASLPLRLGALITLGGQKLSELISRAWEAAGLVQWTQGRPSLTLGSQDGNDELTAACTPHPRAALLFQSCLFPARREGWLDTVRPTLGRGWAPGQGRGQREQ